MPPPSNKALRVCLNVGLGICVITWAILIAFAVQAGAEGRALHPTVHFLALPLAVLTALLGFMRAGLWLLTRVHIQAIGQMLDTSDRKPRPHLVDARHS